MKDESRLCLIVHVGLVMLKRLNIAIKVSEARTPVVGNTFLVVQVL